MLNEGLQAAVLIQASDEGTLDNDVVFLLRQCFYLAHAALNAFAPQKAIVLFDTIQRFLRLQKFRIRLRTCVIKLLARRRLGRQRDFIICHSSTVRHIRRFGRQRYFIRQRLACTVCNFHISCHLTRRQLAFCAITIANHIHGLQRKSGRKLLGRLLHQSLGKMGGTAKMHLPLTSTFVYTNLIDMHKLQLHQLYIRKGQRSQKAIKFIFIRNQAIFLCHVLFLSAIQ